MLKRIILIMSLLFTHQGFTSTNNTNKIMYPDQDLECFVTSSNKRYEDIFIVNVRSKGYSHLYYKRKHLAAPAGEYGKLEIVRGCYTAIQNPTEHRPETISIDCYNDGEEGFISINSKSLKGDIYFYSPKIGYPERISIDIECKHI